MLPSFSESSSSPPGLTTGPTTEEPGDCVPVTQTTRPLCNGKPQNPPLCRKKIPPEMGFPGACVPRGLPGSWSWQVLPATPARLAPGQAAWRGPGPSQRRLCESLLSLSLDVLPRGALSTRPLSSAHSEQEGTGRDGRSPRGGVWGPRGLVPAQGKPRTQAPVPLMHSLPGPRPGRHRVLTLQRPREPAWGRHAVWTHPLSLELLGRPCLLCKGWAHSRGPSHQEEVRGKDARGSGWQNGVCPPGHTLGSGSVLCRASKEVGPGRCPCTSHVEWMHLCARAPATWSGCSGRMCNSGGWRASPCPS